VKKFNPEVGKRARHKYLGKVLGLDVWTVKSWIVREYETEFADDGNHGRYPWFVPKNEVWLEIGLTLCDYDLCAIIIHGSLEAYVMNEFAIKYDNAHEVADYYEKEFRAFTKEHGWDKSWSVIEMADYWARIYLDKFTG